MGFEEQKKVIKKQLSERTDYDILNVLSIFNQELNDLYDAESYDKPMVFMDNGATERCDVRGFMNKWKQMSETQMNCFYQQFLLNLRYEQEDVKAILDQFKRYDSVYTKYIKSRTFLNKCIEKNPDRDYAQNEQMLRERKGLLDIMCKIILIKQTPTLWNAKIKTYNDCVTKYINTTTQRPF